MGEYVYNNSLSSQSGQTIIEVLIALSTAVVIVAASTLAVLTAINNASYTQTQNSATRYAQEGIEFVRYLRGSNFTEFDQLVGNTTYCLDKGGTSLYEASKSCNNQPSCGDNVEKYSRSVVITKTFNKCAPSVGGGTPVPVNTGAQVTVTVSWTDSKCPTACPCHQSQLVSCLSDYSVVGAPADPTNTPTPTPL